ncbi:hypothetical protein [Longispora fulva]|uniref:Uncharacterized protein n=1 Tax=Longispora fulva TaxID=619741 RepID=A0A8J7KWU2_9ACTN|nr:hypothetical protein [Longispora fulva]MBG6136952.1 hypothetical protein [Longispora fulva]
MRRPDAPLQLTAGLIVRACALVVMWGILTWTGPRFDHPWQPVALLAAVTAVSAVVAARWWRAGRAGRVGRAVDLPLGVAMLVVGALILPPGGTGWLYFAAQYTQLLSFAVGLTAGRLWWALGVGVSWAATLVVVGVGIRHQPLAAQLAATPGFLVNPLVGWSVARYLRTSTTALRAAQLQAVAQAAALATATEREAYAGALHDRALQIMELLAADGVVTEPGQAARVREVSAWLRDFVDTGRTEPDLLAALRTIAQAADRPVRLHDSALRAEPVAAVPVLVAAVAAVLACGSGPVTVRAAPRDGGVRITVVGEDVGDGGGAGPLLARAGGRLVAEPLCLELWAPVR